MPSLKPEPGKSGLRPDWNCSRRRLETAGACDGRLAADGGLAPQSTGGRSSAVLA